MAWDCQRGTWMIDGNRGRGTYRSVVIRGVTAVVAQVSPIRAAKCLVGISEMAPACPNDETHHVRAKDLDARRVVGLVVHARVLGIELVGAAGEARPGPVVGRPALELGDGVGRRAADVEVVGELGVAQVALLPQHVVALKVHRVQVARVHVDLPDARAGCVVPAHVGVVVDEGQDDAGAAGLLFDVLHVARVREVEADESAGEAGRVRAGYRTTTSSP